MHLVVTSCTNRKRLKAHADLCASGLPEAYVEDLSKDWVARLRRDRHKTPASSLYAGRNFQEAQIAAKILDAPLAIVSAGLGLVDQNDPIPPYDLSIVAYSTHSITKKLSGNESLGGWWAALSAKSPFARPLSDFLDELGGVVLIALSQPYLQMIRADLNALPAERRQRLRIVSRAPLEAIEPGMRPFVMPYDDRLDGPDSVIRGTRGDFAARAAHHFARYILLADPYGSREKHTEAVLEALAPWQPAPKFERQRCDDETLLQLMRANWDAALGSSTRLLRVLRDDLNIACEQGRFKLLMGQLREELRLVA